MGKNRIILPKDVDYTQTLRNWGLPHTMILTSQTVKAETDTAIYIMPEKRLLAPQLAFLRAVKDCALKSGVEYERVGPENVFYYGFGPDRRGKSGKLSDVVEVDVNMAYWRIARDMGIIDQKVYDNGLKQDKNTRLVAFGALATCARVFGYDPITGNYDYIEDKVDELLRSYFFRVAAHLGKLMQDFCEAHNWRGLHFYWVDAFFCDEYMADTVTDYFAMHGLEVKRKRLALIRWEKKKRNTILYATEVIDRGWDKTDINIKTFNKPGQGGIREKVLDQLIKNINT